MTRLPFWLQALVLALVLVILWALVHAYNGRQQGIGEDRVRAEWAAADKVRSDQALLEAQGKDREGRRRLEIQQRNQDAQDQELAAARAAADLNAADADRVRQQAADHARQWAERLAHSPSAEDVAAAGSAIALCADVRGRLDQAAGVLAGYAGAARAAGLKCERDYDALTAPR